jgi:hypothetical protein
LDEWSKFWTEGKLEGMIAPELLSLNELLDAIKIATRFWPALFKFPD